MVLYVDNIVKRFGFFIAVDNVTFEVNKGEIFTLLGPSGCGKTTILRIIAGLVQPDNGRIYIDNKDITSLPPEKRNIGMVFQNYALWPHMNVYDNIAFGLKLRKFSENEIRKKVKYVLELVKLDGYENRYPSQLSGGQQQRIALARALVLNPHVLLLDEPLSNLDARLREELRYEIREIVKKLEITTVYVTHDQIEAFAISDRIGVMNKGKLIQVGKPHEVYENPRNKYVASFIGNNILLEGVLKMIRNGYGVVEIKNNMKITGVTKFDDSHNLVGKQVVVVIKPEAVEIVENEMKLENMFICNIDKIIYMGSIVEHRVYCEDLELKFYTLPITRLSEGITIKLRIDPSKTLILAE